MIGGGPTMVMRNEHREIGACVESLARKIQAQNSETVLEEETLLELLDRHNMSEEEVLYPEMDRLISLEEREAAFRAMDKADLRGRAPR